MQFFSLHLSHHGYSLLYEHITRYNYPSRYLCKCSTFNVSCEGDCWNSYLAIKFSDPLENPFTIQLDNRQREGETTPANVGPVRKECSFTVQLVNNKVSLYVCKVTIAPALYTAVMQKMVSHIKRLSAMLKLHVTKQPSSNPRLFRQTSPHSLS